MTQRHLIVPDQGRESRVAELHRLCDEDYAKGKQQRAVPRLSPSYAAASLAAVTPTEPSDLDVAIHVAQQLLDSDSVLSLREALRLLLRAHGADPTTQPAPVEPPALRCPAAIPSDASPCGGPVVVMVLGLGEAGVAGCEHHAVRLMTVAPGTYPVGLPHAPAGTATRLFRAVGEAGRR
ncbi:hypothetical protein AB0911_30470 [Streptomyces nigra]|uniref:hypothetical protein n=1 Tax=Streptomyces nigra TaxID=1827580 RepID=UPI0034528936